MSPCRRIFESSSTDIDGKNSELKEMDDRLAELLRRACERDENAAAELIRDFEPELRRFIRYRLTDPQLRRFLDSLDICQSVLGIFFLQLAKGNLNFESPKQISSLLSAMAKNKILDKVRMNQAIRRGGPQKRLAQEEMVEIIAGQETNPHDAMANHELVNMVRDALSESDRKILDLWMAGSDWEEIGLQIGGSGEALRKRLSRAIDTATQKLGLLNE